MTRRELETITAAALVEHGILPDEGGWQEQAATFTAAWPLAMQEINHWRDARRKAAASKK